MVISKQEDTFPCKSEGNYIIFCIFLLPLYLIQISSILNLDYVL